MIFSKLTSLGIVTCVVFFPPLPLPPPEPSNPGLPKEFDDELFQPFLSPPPPPNRDVAPPLPFKGDLELFPNGATNDGLELPKGDGAFGPRPNGDGRLGDSKEDLLLKLK